MQVTPNVDRRTNVPLWSPPKAPRLPAYPRILVVDGMDAVHKVTVRALHEAGIRSNSNDSPRRPGCEATPGNVPSNKGASTDWRWAGAIIG
jgi:hypothetical protein